MVAIVCSSPFHIFTAIVLQHSVYKECDVEIIVLNYCAGIDIIADRLRQEKIFYDVIMVDAKKILDKFFYKKDRLFRAYCLACSDNFLKEWNIHVDGIDELLYPYCDPVAVIMAKSMGKRDDRRFVFFDDGFGARFERFSAGPRLEIMLGVPLRFYIPHMIYTYDDRISHKNGILANNICVPNDAVFKTMINNVFMYQKNAFDYQYLFFDQFSKHYDEADNVIKLINSVDSDKPFSTRCLVKKHPKRLDDIYEKAGMITCDNINVIPYEVIALNDDRLESRYLLSDYSTALFTPKLLYGKEPKVIFLYRLIHPDYPLEKMENYNIMYEYLLELYENKAYVMRPENIEELLLCLEL